MIGSSLLLQTKQLRSRPIGLLVAGSTTDIEEVSKLLHCGYDAIHMGCEAFEDRDPLGLIIAVVGAARVFSQPKVLGDIIKSLELAALGETIKKVDSFNVGDGNISPRGPLTDARKELASYESSDAGDLSPDPVLDSGPLKKVSPNPAPQKKQKVVDVEVEVEKSVEGEKLVEGSGEHVFPTDMCCRLTNELFLDPVITPLGATYKRDAIVDHLSEVFWDPCTYEDLVVSDLKDDDIMKGRISQYIKARGLVQDPEN